MKWIKMILQILILFVVCEVGVIIQQFFNLFIPGSVIGLILMFVILTTGILPLQFVEEGSKFMNKHLVLFFIPATVGIMNYYELFAGKGVLLIFITMLSTFCVIGSAGFVSQWLTKKGEENHG